MPNLLKLYRTWYTAVTPRKTMLQFVFPPHIQAGIASNIYTIVKSQATGQLLGIARDAATGRFVGNAVAMGINPLASVSSLIGLVPGVIGNIQNHKIIQKSNFMIEQNKMILSQLGALQSSVGVLQATTAAIGVGVVVTGAISAVNLYQTMKLRKAVQKLDIKVENGFLDLKALLRDQGQAIQEQIDRVAEDIKFEQHRIELIRAYSHFIGASKLIQKSLLYEDLSQRKANLANALQTLHNALEIYRSPQILSDNNPPGLLRRYECAWAIEQAIAIAHTLENEMEVAGRCIGELQEQIRRDAIAVAERCETQEELDFVFPELKHIHDNDLQALELWQAQIDWTRSLSSEEAEQLQAIEFTPLEDAPLAVAEPAAMAEYNAIKDKSHFASQRDQIKLMMSPQLRETYIQTVSDRAQKAGHTALTPKHLDPASPLAIANLYHYLQEV